MRCFNCDNIISKNNSIYKGFDNNFCNSKCRLNIINNLVHIDPENNNPQLWSKVLVKIDSPLKKTKSISNLNYIELDNNTKNNKHYNRNCFNIFNYDSKFNLLKYLFLIVFLFYSKQ